MGFKAVFSKVGKAVQGAFKSAPKPAPVAKRTLSSGVDKILTGAGDILSTKTGVVAAGAGAGYYVGKKNKREKGS